MGVVRKNTHSSLAEQMVMQLARKEIERQMSTFVSQLLVDVFKYGTLADLGGGSVVQTHAEITPNGLGKPVLKTKVSQLSNMKKGETVFMPCEKNIKLTPRQKEKGYNRLIVSVHRWRHVVGDVEEKCGHRFTVNIDRENNGTIITRIK